ncbi:MAG: cytochrome c [Myxococcaceae bacterium]
MLSKSAAKAFFLGGTALTATAFLALTWDTFQQIPARTHADRLSESAIRGKHLWEDNNCMGCHTLFGEGAYYAPELTKVIERRGATFVKLQLKDPEKMYPGERKMTNYHFTDAQIDDLVAFFEWAGQVDLNGFPAKPTLSVALAPKPGAPTTAAAANRPQVFGQICVTCHSLEGVGGQIGPALDGVGSRRDQAYLEKWLRDPVAVKADSKMPKLPLEEAQLQELVAFLSNQKAKEVTP